MDTKTFTFRGVTYTFIDDMPDGDYTIGRGADPRRQGKTAATSAKSRKLTKPPAKVSPATNLQRRDKIVGA